MLKITEKKHLLFFFLGITISVTGCKNLQSTYSAQAYQQAISLKVEAMALMDEATNPYSEHEEKIVEVKREMTKAYEYARRRPNNEESTQQWELMIDSDNNLMAGFLKKWEDDETLSANLIENSNVIISDAFETII
jgi:hypothetical protein